jgi:hypothetical protein
MKIRVGVDSGRRAILSKAKALNAPILVSANSLWNDGTRTFSGWQSYTGFDVALDSGGFVAMHRYGGYRWTINHYVKLAHDMRPTWWAQMDFCCEPEIAKDRKAVFARIDRTAQHLQECKSTAAQMQAEPPMPVLQGWEPADYCQGPAYDPGFHWPDLVGIGSVCRRSVKGRAGIMAVTHALDNKLPRHVKFHLFGVKSTALQILVNEYPHRVASVDSMAWNVDARWHAFHNKIPCGGALKARMLEQWYTKQTEHIKPGPQLQLFTE